jgi:hypothetical protein
LPVCLDGVRRGRHKTVTETKTVTTPAQPQRDADAILDATAAFYAAGVGGGVTRENLSLVKMNGTFADVLVAGDAHAILKKGGDRWIVVWDGNGIIPPETRDRFGIPADYGG